MREIRLKEIMQKISADCAQLGLVVSGGHTQVEAGNTRAVVAVTAVGFTENVKEPHAVGSNMANGAGDDIIMTKCIGIGGVQYIINNNREKILEKYVEDVVKRAYGNRSGFVNCKRSLYSDRKWCCIFARYVTGWCICSVMGYGWKHQEQDFWWISGQ